MVEFCIGGNLVVVFCVQVDIVVFYDIGVVIFSDEVKCNVLQVCVEILVVYSVVSEVCVQEMFFGILVFVGVDIVIVVSGYVGLEGGEDGIFVGMVWFVWNFCGQIEIKWMCFVGDCEIVVVKVV